MPLNIHRVTGATAQVNELYMGRRGVLFWLNKAAYASVFILIGGWVIFRFVGPNLGEQHEGTCKKCAQLRKARIL
jgi:p-aminobenzoyl-glutamate transporter AbgT